MSGREFSQDPGASVLLIGRDVELRSKIAQLYQGAGYETREVDSARSAEEVFEAQPVDLILLVGQPTEASVLTFCRTAAEAVNTSILVMADEPDLTDEIVVLETGADGLIAKTADGRLLLARSRALLRRTRQFSRSIASTSGVWKVDRRLRRAIAPSGTQIQLTQLMLDLMDMFLSNPGLVITPEIAASLLHETTTEADNLRTPIARLRRRLEAAGEGGAIRTVYGMGYVFDGALDGPQVPQAPHFLPDAAA